MSQFDTQLFNNDNYSDETTEIHSNALATAEKDISHLQTTSLSINELYNFPNYIYPLSDDNSPEMQELICSIRNQGVSQPIIVRRKTDNGYEIISGHRRVQACRFLDIEQVPAIIKEYENDDLAVLDTIYSNITRHKLEIGVRARIYKKMRELEQRQGRKITLEQIAQSEGKSEKTIRRAIHLAENLIQGLLDMLDIKTPKGKTKFPSSAGLEITKLNTEQQNILLKVLNDDPERTLTIEKAKSIRALGINDELTEEKLQNLLSEPPKKIMKLKEIKFREDELSEYFETGTSTDEMRDVILNMLKERQQSKSLNSDKLSNNTETHASDVPTALEPVTLPEAAPLLSPIGKSASYIPRNSGIPIAESLTDLTIDEMLETVLSNAFVPDIVTQNTIIWDNWDIFSKTKYLWKVVRKRPDWVKLWVINKCYHFVCRPMERKKNCYQALLYCIEDGGKTKKLSYEKKAQNLYEAVLACENVIDDHNEKHPRNPYNVQRSPYKNMKPLASLLSPLEFEKKLCALGVKENVAKDLTLKGAYICEKVCEILSEDIEPEKGVLAQLRGKYMELDLLSKSEADFILNHIKWKG